MPDPAEVLVGFARALRIAGLPVTADRTRTMVEAVSLAGFADPNLTYWAARSATCTSPADLEVYDRVFRSWFRAAPLEPSSPDTVSPPAEIMSALELRDGEELGDGDIERAAASDVETLRHKDIAALSEEQRAHFRKLFLSLRPRAPRRRSFRRTRWRRGEVDRPRTLRGMRANLGEAVEISWRHRATRPRRVILLLDVSGSMEPYADALLRLAHRFVSSTPGLGSIEVMTVGTRLTRVTRSLMISDVEEALASASRVVPDWSGGTRLGETLKAFLDRWGQRGMARGAVAVIFSDGWERGDATLLGEQMRRLRLLAHYVVWVNPHKGSDGFEPVQRGMAAALPHVDALLAGHSLSAFERVVRVVAEC